ncbi:hypothetical protein Pcinc_041923, partial [Petrolisthes cinctipes]
MRGHNGGDNSLDKPEGMEGKGWEGGQAGRGGVAECK